MSDQAQNTDAKSTSRRDFIKTSSFLVAGGAVGSTLSVARAAHPFGSDVIKLGLIGCGGRGSGAAVQAMNTLGGEVKLVAMGDVFDDRLQGGGIAIGERPGLGMIAAAFAGAHVGGDGPGAAGKAQQGAS